jgi:hypothetical protein
MADQEAFGIIGAGSFGGLDFDDGILATRDNVAIWVLTGRREEGDGVDVFGTTADQGCVEVRGRCLGAAPYADAAIAGGG